MTSDAIVREIVAERIRLMSQKVLHPEVFQDARLSVSRELPGEIGRLVLMLDAYIVGMPKERIDVKEKWPADWWQAFRERWFPAWWLRRWPVEYRSVSIHKTIYGKVCPHVRVPEQAPHLQWLAQG